jgi:hypothetical protein
VIMMLVSIMIVSVVRPRVVACHDVSVVSGRYHSPFAAILSILFRSRLHASRVELRIRRLKVLVY